MLHVEKPALNRVDVRLEGAVDADEMREGLDRLIALSEDVTHGRMLYRISDFEMPTLGAIAIELSRLPKLLRLLGRFDRCAVLADAEWLREAAEFEGRLLPGVEIRSFDFHDVLAAERWLADG